MKFAVVSFLLFMSVMIHCHASRRSSNAKNVVPLKTIESPDGDVIDCVGIYVQPAFDHPLLKNHTILKEPSYRPDGFSTITNPVTQLWNLKESCPEGTIPIRRTTPTVNPFKKHPWRLSQSSSSPNSTPVDQRFIHEHASVKVDSIKYHGTQTVISVWQPQVQIPEEFSLAQVWVAAGPDSDINTLEVGWQVYPGMYGDDRPRLFVFWTNNGYQSGCYNLVCPGFVQTSSVVVLGAAFYPVSTYHGQSYEVDIKVWKDSKQNVWWMSYQNVTVGYWATAIVPRLADAALRIDWGGEVINSGAGGGGHTTTQMGSGHFAEEVFEGAAFFRHIMVIDESDQVVDPADKIVEMENPSCYNLICGHNGPSGNYFFFGGPGRNPNCP